VSGPSEGAPSDPSARGFHLDGLELEPVANGSGFEGQRDPFGGLAEPGWAPSGLPVKTPGGSYAELQKRAGRNGHESPGGLGVSAPWAVQ
jgi:hypothetical protein